MINCNLQNNVDWMDLVQVRFQWLNLVKEVMKRFVFIKVGAFLHQFNDQ
jgi:hypothetical protein